MHLYRCRDASYLYIESYVWCLHIEVHFQHQSMNQDSPISIQLHTTNRVINIPQNVKFEKFL